MIKLSTTDKGKNNTIVIFYLLIPNNFSTLEQAHNGLSCTVVLKLLNDRRNYLLVDLFDVYI